jgi:hypothetical protein
MGSSGRFTRIHSASGFSTVRVPLPVRTKRLLLSRPARLGLRRENPVRSSLELKTWTHGYKRIPNTIRFHSHR